MAGIPKIAAPDENFAASRETFSSGLRELNSYFDAQISGGHDAVGVSTPFYLAYQPTNNRGLLSAYGKLCAKIMRRWQDQQLPWPRPRGAGELPVRVGIVSAYVRHHSVWNAIVKGWIAHLDRKSIELHLFHLGVEEDSETQWAKANVKSFAPGKRGLREWAEIISGKAIQVLIYPEIGMDSMTLKLASLRLAPVQAAAWGHPETTGLPTMDYYLSAEAFEPPERNANYVEKLIALPNLGCCYSPPPVAAAEPDFARLGLAVDSPILICPGAPFKYAPRDDFIFVEIARRLGKCRLVFFTWQVRALSEMLQRRLEARFSAANLKFADYGVFIPWQPTAQFYGLLKRADVFLDTLGFSGFNTAMQAVECSLPIVTRDGEFMRGRLASGILKRMGMHELIAPNTEDYIRLAVRLAKDAGYRWQVRQQIEAVRGILYEDVSSVRALEHTLLSMAAEQRSAC
jgi:predicted O-linked N-acetylglucosamine transferase (SPINDLY family)